MHGEAQGAVSDIVMQARLLHMLGDGRAFRRLIEQAAASFSGSRSGADMRRVEPVNQLLQVCLVVAVDFFGACFQELVD